MFLRKGRYYVFTQAAIERRFLPGFFDIFGKKGYSGGGGVKGTVEVDIFLVKHTNENNFNFLVVLELI